VKIYFTGSGVLFDWDVSQINLSCLIDNLQCDSEPVNVLASIDLNAWEINISPDGTKMIFLSDYPSRQSDIFLYEFEDQSITRLTNSVEYEFMLNWSPSGKFIAYVDSGPRRIQVITNDGKLHLTIPTTHVQIFSPIWSNDGTRIAYYANDGEHTTNYLYYYDLETGESTQLPVSRVNTDYDIVWSPDDELIIYFEHQSVADICIFEIKSTNSTCLTRTPKWDSKPDWSPDGEKIAFSVLNQYSGSSSIWVMNSDGSNKSRVASVNGEYKRPTWVLNSKYLLCDRRIDDIWQPVLISVSDETEIRLAETTFDLRWRWVSSE
jgi:Tol biopolymer transport system component